MAGLRGFRLYAGNTAICPTSNPHDRQLRCTAPAASAAPPACFSMTAYDANGRASLHSSPYCL